ncbi:MAG: MFS transporter [Chloroflexi bacterium]|nr:MFS transporter [Chloroflexota bacterium]
MTNRKPEFFYGYTIVMAAFVYMAIQMGVVNTFGVFLKPVLDEFGWGRAMISGAFSLSMMLSALLGLAAGRLNDKFGPRLLITAGGLLLGAGYLLMSRLNSLWQLYVFFGVVTSLGFGISFIPVISTVARWFDRKRSTMTGFVTAGIGTGIMLLSLFAGWLIESYGWRTSFAVLGITALVLIVGAAQFFRRDPHSMGLQPDGTVHTGTGGLDLQVTGLSLAQAVRTRQLWMLNGLYFCLGFTIYAVLVHIVIYATGLGISESRAVGILSVLGGLNIAGRVVMGSSGDRLGNRRTLMMSLVVLSLALVWLLFAREPWMLYLFAGVFGFTYSVTLLESPMVAELFGLKSHGLLLAIVDAGGFTIGVTAGPVVAGYLFDVTGSYQLSFLISLALTLVALVLTWRLSSASAKGSVETA